jgi:hypothetical protein
MHVFNRRSFAWITIAGVCVVAVVLYSTPEQLCPSWSVSVIEPSGIPVTRTTVRRSCQDYSVAGRATESDASTDDFGHVVFPEVIVRVHPALRWVTDLFHLISGGVHASFGRHARVFAISGDGRQAWDVTVDGFMREWKGTPSHMESRLVMRDTR